MAWYNIIFFISLLIFFIKFFISIFVGNVDLDVDFDGDSDFDTSGAFSFKGFLHFILGSSLYLSAKAYFMGINMPITTNGNVIFYWYDYIIGIICGIIFVFILYYGYKLAMKASQTPKNPLDVINNSKGIIYLNLGNGQYSVEAHTIAGTTNVTAFYSSDDLEPGTEVTLSKENNNILINYIS